MWRTPRYRAATVVFGFPGKGSGSLPFVSSLSTQTAWQSWQASGKGPWSQSSGCDSRWGTGTEQQLGVLAANSLVPEVASHEGQMAHLVCLGPQPHSGQGRHSQPEKAAPHYPQGPAYCSPSSPSCFPGRSWAWTEAACQREAGPNRLPLSHRATVGA